MNAMKVTGLIILAVALVVAYSALFTVKEWEKALVLRFGEIKRADNPPGLHAKLPLIENVTKFDGRILTLDAPAEPFLTVEKKNVQVDSFVKWRISDTGAFYTAMGGDEFNARSRILQIVNRGLRDEFGKRTIQEAISGERKQIMSVILVNAQEQLKTYGIDIVDVRIKRIDLPENVSDSVYQRMESERKRVAKEFRSQGAEQAERIQAEADRQVEIINAEAYRDAEKIKGEGDAQAADIYATAFTANPEFYSFYRSLFAYREVFSKQDSSNVFVLEPTNEFFKHFGEPRVRGDKPDQ